MVFICKPLQLVLAPEIRVIADVTASPGRSTTVNARAAALDYAAAPEAWAARRRHLTCPTAGPMVR